MSNFIGKMRIVNKAKVEAQIKKVEKKFLGEVKGILSEIMIIDVVPDAKENVSGKKLGGKVGATGLLAKAIGQRVVVKGNKVIASLTVDLKKAPYGRIHYLGGIIKPKNVKYLTIPFPGIKGFAREYTNTFVIKGKKNKKNLIMGTSEGGKFKALFTLTKQVKIPKRDYLTPALKRNFPKMKRMIKKLTERDFN